MRTIRQRRGRARKGQVSAVAVLFGLLLVVSFISNYLLYQLPQLEQQVELQHVLQVENQLARLQSTILAQIANPQAPLIMSTPVTLGSLGVPPFGLPVYSSVAAESPSIQTNAGYGVSQIFPSPPNWNTGSSCLNGGAGKCSGNGNVDTWNVSGMNGTTFSLKVTGNHNSVLYNITGNNDTINIDWTGGDTGVVNFIINGSDNIINYNKGGSDTNNPVSQFFFYGQNDTFNFAPSGSHSGKGGMTINVVFVGDLNEICPYGNLSASDEVGTLGSGGSNLHMNVTWWNAVGYTSGPKTVAYPGGSLPGESLTWINQTGFVACAFTKTYGSTYASVFGSGVVVHIPNRYLPMTDVAYDQGAVIDEQVGGTAIMVSPPSISFQKILSGYAASVTLVNVLANVSIDTGYATSAITTQLLSVQSITIGGPTSEVVLGAPFLYNVTTAYPSAWTGFFAKFPQIFPYKASCTTTAPISKPFTCLAPPPGVWVRLSVSLVVQQLTLTMATVSLAVI